MWFIDYCTMCLYISLCSPYIPLSQLQTIHEGGAGDDSKDANSDSEEGQVMILKMQILIPRVAAQRLRVKMMCH